VGWVEHAGCLEEIRHEYRIIVGNTYGKRLLALLFVHEGAIIGKLCDCYLEGNFPSVCPI